MLKVRYSKETGILSGWATETEIEFATLEARMDEDVAVLDIAKPNVDDYEYFIYQDEQLKPSGKLPPDPLRDPLAEIDEIKAKIADYDTLKAKVEMLEKK